MPAAPCCDFIVLSGPEPAVAVWLAALQPDQVVQRGALALAAWACAAGGDRPLHATSTDGKNLAVLCGFLPEDCQWEAALLDRGMRASALDHPALAADVVAWHGPEGLGQLRWQGTLGVLHPARGLAMVARDLFGVGGLWLATAAQTEATQPGAGVTLLATAPARLPLALQPRLRPVPPGLVALVGPRGVQWQRLRPAARHAAFLAQPDDAQLPTTVEAVQTWLAAQTQALLASAGRALGVPVAPVAGPAWWPIAAADRSSGDAVPGLQLSWAGAETWPPDATAPALPDLPWAAALPDAPEPTGSGVPPMAVAQRLQRAFGLGQAELAATRAAADAPLVAPALDPTLLAVWNALPAPLRAAVVASAPLAGADLAQT